jgi:hypothetical protein
MKYLFILFSFTFSIKLFSQSIPNKYYLNLDINKTDFKIEYNLHFYDVNNNDSTILISCSEIRSSDYFNLYLFLNRGYVNLDSKTINSNNILSLNILKDSIKFDNKFISNNKFYIIFKNGAKYFTHETKIVHTLYKEK